MAYLSYYILPDLTGKEKLRRHSALPGSIFFCISWLLGSWGFSLYVNNLHTYNFVYGTIAGFAVMMMWLYYTSILILIGGEINSQLYEKLERKDTINLTVSQTLSSGYSLEGDEFFAEVSQEVIGNKGLGKSTLCYHIANFRFQSVYINGFKFKVIS